MPCCRPDLASPCPTPIPPAQAKQQLQFRLPLSRPSLAFLWDHKVEGTAIMPGAAYCEIAAAAARALLRLPEPAVALTAAAIAAPLRLPAAAQAGAVVVTADVALLGGDVSIRSAPAAGGGRAAAAEMLHLRGTLALVAAGTAAALAAPKPAAACVSADAMRAACRQPSDTAAVYRGLQAAGLQYGPAFRQLRGIQQGDSAAAASLGDGSTGTGFQAQQDADVSGFLLHPALLDSCLQLGALVPEPAGTAAGDAAYVPASVAVYLVQQPLPQGAAAAAVVRRSPDAQRKAAAATYRDHTLLSGTGAMLAILAGLEAKQLNASGSRPAAAAAAASKQQQTEVLYEVAWQAATGAAAVEPMAAHAQALPSSAAAPLATIGGGLQALQSALQQQAGAVQLQTVGGPLPGAVAASSSSVAAADGSALWGMLRAFAAEAPTVAHGGVRADPLAVGSSSRNHIALASSASSRAADGYSSLLQGGAALHAALLPSSHVRAAPAAHHLVPRPRGAFRNLAPELVPVGTAAPGWVEVEVKAVGINFR